MASYNARVQWQHSDEDDFTKGRYSRAHTWSFDGGAELAASSSPHIVPLPFSDENAVDPEEAFVASLSSCHMLFLLHFAAKAGYIVQSYEDNACGKMAQDEQGKLAMTEVVLNPKVVFSNNNGADKPSEEQLAHLHHLAHEQCFIANSVKTNIITNIVNP
ncbi:OsmC family peroxiredoxin [Shewanella sp. Scap07]|uniref:OsmC family protein n=2 Tax=Shewanella TaxID=22 RepID=UPI0015BF14EB|nr:OsmC family protein [Shewanella sp. Scap07]QLE86265.1 OsmC family peroxiredoxin [Shewanella sp. Scap07]